ncbi:MAG: chromate resistance protein, partial [Anaerolineae bacterium]|nr:chromate resistance protein [Anaerolineae bacterium]
FHQARQENYASIDEKATLLAQNMHQELTAQERLEIKDELDGLLQQHADIARIDYFESPDKVQLAARLERLRQTLLTQTRLPVEIPHAGIEAYRDKRWVTRPRPYVDRLACAWLIRRYVNPEANIRYGATPAPDEIAFDMPNTEFSHRGDLCTFEVMLQILDLDDPVLQTVAEIIHEIDLGDGMYPRTEASGVGAVLRGWQLDELPDSEMEARGITLFEGLYVALAGHAL